MSNMITRAVHRQWSREFTAEDARACYWLCLPLGLALIIFAFS